MENINEEAILENAISWIKDNKKVALATVVETWGSSPFQVGTKMIISNEGNFIGSVSGGCIEAKVIEECIELFKNKISVGSRKGTLRFANYDWEWETITSKTTVDKFYRLDVSVSLLGDNVPSRSIVGFIFDDEIENE